MKTPLLLCALLVGAPAHTGSLPADNYPKNPNVDVLNYAFHLTLSDASDRIVGRAVIDVKFNAAGEAALWFDLANVGESDQGRRGMLVTAVRLSQPRIEPAAAEFSHESDRLRVTLPEPSEAGGHMTVLIDYEGIPATGLRIGPNKHGDRTFFSDNWPNRARAWLPTVDHPYDKATNEFVVTAPNHYQVVSNGVVIEETDLQDGNRRTHWKQSVPIATWLYVLGVAEFAVQQVDDHDGKAIETWVYAKDRDAGFYDFAVPTKQAMEYYAEYVGPYAYERLANIQSASVGGGMEAATSIFYAESSVTGERTERWRNVIIHEVAHQWFGNAVTEYDWDDVWLSEGFATYFTLLFIEHAYGRDEFVDGLRSAAERVWTWYDDHPDYRIVHENLADMGQVTSIATYQKGAWVLHMLRSMLGEEAWWGGIQSYYAAHLNGNATTADFVSEMELASGQDLGWFFEQWLYRGGNPSLRGSWHYDSNTKQIVVDLQQESHDGFAFRLPLEIGVYATGATLPTVHQVDIEGLTHRFTISADEAPERVSLDPRSRALFRMEFGLR